MMDGGSWNKYKTDLLPDSVNIFSVHVVQTVSSGLA